MRIQHSERLILSWNFVSLLAIMIGCAVLISAWFFRPQPILFICFQLVLYLAVVAVIGFNCYLQKWNRGKIPWTDKLNLSVWLFNCLTKILDLLVATQ